MTSQISSYKRMLTQYLNKLEAVISRFKDEQLENIKWEGQDRSSSFVTNGRRRLEEGLGALESYISKIEDLLAKYASVIDEIESPSAKESEDFEQYSVRAESVLCNAVDYTVLLQARLRALKGDLTQRHRMQETHEEITSNIARVDLPTLPIPSFGGNIWEWDNFWSLFNANVHSQTLPDFFKFNYLLQALKGDAYNAVKRFQVTAENYNKAIDFLKKKYGNSEELINNLIDRMDSLVMRTQSMRDQRILLEQLQVIAEQLKVKGENVDSQWFLKQVLAKFTVEIQRKVLEKKHSLGGGAIFGMDLLFQFLDEVISTEETVALYTKKTSQRLQSEGLERSDKNSKPSRLCMYCADEHKSIACTKYKTAQERSQYLRENKLCLICASSRHSTRECKKRLCFICQGAHHTSCCYKTIERHDQGVSRSEQEEAKKRSSTTGNKRGTKPSNSQEVNVLMQDEQTQQETSILQLQSSQQNSLSHIFLPTGDLTVMNPRTRELIKVPALLDTGAELSFIEENLAEELGLPLEEETKLRLRTFGSEDVREHICYKVTLEIWDNEGLPLTLNLLTNKILTKAVSAPPLLKMDKDFIKAVNIPINFNKSGKLIVPRILLGCDQLWTLIQENESHIRLPSGLSVISTRLGHLLTGQMELPKQAEQATYRESLERRETIEEMDTQANVIVLQGLKNEEELSEEELFTRYCVLESSGSEQFSSAEHEVRSKIDQQVWNEFVNTVEKREDGYYVRLPWKNINAELPDNKAIAYKRLCSLWKSLQQNSELLDKYDKVFQEQRSSNIIEEVNDKQLTKGRRIHYIPHQMVLTPNKTTTKLRVVFDASAHFTNQPSLNDMLHRGPVILPQLFGLLLRFRFGQIALVADVEKAFLQIRLHEEDRDATRCLWLREHKQPPRKENIQTYRFTRITFGLIPSPFLLAATTHYHLDQYKNEAALVSQIKENLYVDNLFITADTTQEALTAYHRTKEIFNDLSMNLREFASNNKTVTESMRECDRSTEENPKVLGVLWKPIEDQFEISCRMSTSLKCTKRTVASAVASVYDPLGWLTPLMHRAKRFLQSLWKDKYDWDVKLQQAKEEEWIRIRADISGFKKSIPRYLANKMSRAMILVFADASSEAIAACAYLQRERTCNLLMARAKLSAFKAKTTMPKKELNAITLALRLTNAILSQIRSSIIVDQVSILSDSEIALSWVTTTLRHDVGPFIKNRVQEIHQIIGHLEEQGHVVKIGHIDSSSNPADCATRGMTKETFTEHYWWSGPSPEKLEQIRWYQLPSRTSSGEECGACYVNLIAQVQELRSDIFSNLKQLSLNEIKRVVAFVLRFIRNLSIRVNQKRKTTLTLSTLLRNHPQKSQTLTGSEIKIAEKIIIKQHQISLISQEILTSFNQLNVKKDQDGILRCFGRMKKSCLEESAINPILVLQNSWLAKKIIDECHNRNHPGVGHTMSMIREQYWIPKLRAQVTKAIRSCVICQKFNNLPFKYPEQGDLPSRRVQKSKPFTHVGLDYFGPLQVIGKERHSEKIYGCVITCLVTRLIHLDIVEDQSTIAFLRMLRRLFARRGKPETITCDNAPTFTLGDTVLSEIFEKTKLDDSITREVSTRGIEWKYITPYAPWQGGVYERLIKSIKISIFKTIGKATVPYEELLTVLTEIEALLNTRPLTYVESDGNIDKILRPIDFLQNEFEYVVPMEVLSEELDDPTYMTPEERCMFKTKIEVLRALQSSWRLTEQAWTLWRTQYLTSLREKHQREVSEHKGSRYTPEVGKLVIISDALQPRHTWKMGRIEELKRNPEGVVREALVMLPSKKRIRRPLNMLIPLELDDAFPKKGTEETKTKEMSLEPSRTNSEQPRYNLRSRRPINYKETSAALRATSPVILIALLTLICTSSEATTTEDTNHVISQKAHFFRCIPGGIELILSNPVPYEICAENFCELVSKPRTQERIKFPAAVTLEDHEVQWKLVYNSSIRIIETLCPAAPFCENIDCTLCATLVFNPECWPLGAIMVTTLVIYFLLTGCYVFLYVPMVVGHPIRVLSRWLAHVVKVTARCLLHSIFARRKGGHKKTETDITFLLAIAILSSTLHAEGCQLVNAISQEAKICTEAQGGKGCVFQMLEILKINPLRREACFKLTRNETVIHEIRVFWINLGLICERETRLFTRDTSFHVIDSKRCPHTGSCVGGKCTNINSSSLIPELQEANQFPGITACVESCGGPGCDCFYWSSGCLFYRIFLKPSSQQIFEIFKCIRWRESAKVKITHMDVLKKKIGSFIVSMQPNVPITINVMKFTLSSITLPPLPLLSMEFISDGTEMALWNTNTDPPLQCTSRETAQKLLCEVGEACSCYPAETKANCNCRDLNISERFQDVQYHLPVILPSVTFKTINDTVQATVPTMTTAEIILNLQDNLDTEILVENTLCTIQDTIIVGCYSCAKGAQAQVLCTSPNPSQAEIVCEQFSFTVPCDDKGVASMLRFSLSNARVHFTCTVSCGKKLSNFEITGVLKFTHATHLLVNDWIKGNSKENSEIQWPDFLHIVDVFLQWYKTLFISLALLCLLLLVTYLYISWCGVRCLGILLRLVKKSLWYFFRVFIYYPWMCGLRLAKGVHQKLL